MRFAYAVVDLLSFKFDIAPALALHSRKIVWWDFVCFYTNFKEMIETIDKEIIDIDNIRLKHFLNF